eukprot:8575493-Pyramimonas_sp.AAC.1
MSVELAELSGQAIATEGGSTYMSDLAERAGKSESNAVHAAAMSHCVNELPHKVLMTVCNSSSATFGRPSIIERTRFLTEDLANASPS